MTGVRTARAFLTTGAAEGELAILSYPAISVSSECSARQNR